MTSRVEPTCGPRDRDAFRRVLRAFFSLSLLGQLEAIDRMIAYLEAGLGRRFRLSAELRRQHEAFRWLDAAAESLQLPPGTPPTVEGYTSVWKTIAALAASRPSAGFLARGRKQPTPLSG